MAPRVLGPGSALIALAAAAAAFLPPGGASMASGPPASPMVQAVPTPNGWIPMSSGMPPVMVDLSVRHLSQISDGVLLLSPDEAVVVGYDQGLGPNGVQPTAIDAVSTTTGRTLWHYGIPYPHKISAPVVSGHKMEFIQFSEGTASPVLVSLSTSGQVLGQTPLAFLTSGDTIDQSGAFPQGILLDVVHAYGQGATYSQTYSLALMGYDGKLLWQTPSTPRGSSAPFFLADDRVVVWPRTGAGDTTHVDVLSLNGGQAVFSKTTAASVWNDPVFLADRVLLFTGEYSDRIAAYAETGRLLWTIRGSIPSLVANGREWVQGRRHAVYLRSVDTGKVIRTIPLGDRTFGRSLAISDRYVVVGLWNPGYDHPVIAVLGIASHYARYDKRNWVHGGAATYVLGASTYTFPNGLGAGYALRWPANEQRG